MAAQIELHSREPLVELTPEEREGDRVIDCKLFRRHILEAVYDAVEAMRRGDELFLPPEISDRIDDLNRFISAHLNIPVDDE